MSVLDSLNKSRINVKSFAELSEVKYQYSVNVGGIHYITLTDEEILDFYYTMIPMFPAVTEFEVKIKHMSTEKWEEYDKRKELWTIIKFNAVFPNVVQLSRFIAFLFSSIERFKIKHTYSLQLVLRDVQRPDEYKCELRPTVLNYGIYQLVRMFPGLVSSPVEEIEMRNFRYGVRKLKKLMIYEKV